MSNITTLNIKTNKKRELIDITSKIQKIVTESTIKNGTGILFVQHTTAALTVADLDPGSDLDLLDAFDRIVPKIQYRHPHDPSHMPDHILSSLVGVSLNVIIQNGKIALGEWQNIVLVEFNGPKDRNVIFSIQNLT